MTFIIEGDKEYEYHVYDVRTSNEQNKKLGFCGAKIWHEKLIAYDAGFMLANIQAGGRLLACSDCRKVILELLGRCYE